MQVTTRPYQDTQSSGLISAFASAPSRLFAWVDRRRRVAAAIRELSWHSDRELADLGVNRNDIQAVVEDWARRD